MFGINGVFVCLSKLLMKNEELSCVVWIVDMFDE